MTPSSAVELSMALASRKVIRARGSASGAPAGFGHSGPDAACGTLRAHYDFETFKRKKTRSRRGRAFSWAAQKCDEPRVPMQGFAFIRMNGALRSRASGGESSAGGSRNFQF